MNLRWTAFLLPAVLLLTGCQDEILDFRNAQISNGLIYAGASNSPFSGTLTNLPFRTIYPRSDATIDALTGRVAEIISALKATDQRTYLTGEICTAGVKDGMVNGEVKCSESQSTVIRHSLIFTSGQPDGDMKAFDKTGNKLLGEAHIKNGLLNGELAVYSPSDGRKLYRVAYKNGLQEGLEEVHAASTGKLVSEMTYVDGKVEGEARQYSVEGSLVGKYNFLNGQREGVQEQYDPKSGRTLVQATWHDGAMDGPMKQWDEVGGLVKSGQYKRNAWYPDPEPSKTIALGSATASGENTDGCVSNWIDAFRKENGEDAVVMNDQLEEWKGWCEAGKAP